MSTMYSSRAALRVGLLATALWCTASIAIAATTVYSGRLDDSANTALVGSGLAPSAPDFTDDLAIANNVALYELTIANPGNVGFVSSGFAAGGIDPYFTIFSGFGVGATFYESNFAQAFSTGGDFNIALALAAGDYTLAIGAFANMSFAENLGVGTLGDGFVGLGQPGLLGDTSYLLTVITSGSTVTPIPEPSTYALMLAGLAAVGAGACRRSRPTSAPLEV